MNWWVKCISVVIAKTASGNVTFKATRMRDSIMEGQDEFIMRKLDDADVGFREDYEKVLADVGYNTDLYVVNQESTDLLREVKVKAAHHTGRGRTLRLRFIGQDPF